MKFSVVGCEASGKTVFMSALSDYFSSADGLCLVPENPAANRFSRFQLRQMRYLRTWPPATKPWRTIEMNWTLRLRGEKLADISMLEFGGETFRAAFRDSENEPEHKVSVKALTEYLKSSDFIVVLVSLKELFREPGDASMEEFERDTEALWVTRGLLEFARDRLPGTDVVIALSQADRYRSQLQALGGAEKAFATRWPTVRAAAPEVKVVELASVSDTDESGNPADGFRTDGVLAVMRELSRSVFGDPKDLLVELSKLEQNQGSAKTRSRKFAAALRNLECASAISGEDCTKQIADAKIRLEELRTAAKAELPPPKPKQERTKHTIRQPRPVVRRVWLLALLLTASIALFSEYGLAFFMPGVSHTCVTRTLKPADAPVTNLVSEVQTPACHEAPATNLVSRSSAEAPAPTNQTAQAVSSVTTQSEDPTNLPPFRIWHDHRGNAISARWLSTAQDGKSIYIEASNGRRIRAVLHKFSEEDRAYVESELARQKREATAVTPPQE